VGLVRLGDGTFQNYVRDSGPLFGPRLLEAQWSDLLTAKKLFPLRAALHDETTNVRFRFEVKSITAAKFTDAELSRPPDGYAETQPPPF